MLRKEEILERTNKGLLVFKHYIRSQWRIGRNFYNPLYEDKNASCNIYFDKHSNCYRLKDFGNNEYSGDCFFYVGKLNGLDCNNSFDFVEILKIIDNDLSLGLSTGNPKPIATTQKKEVSNPTQEKPEIEKEYRCIDKDFDRHELKYWKEIDVDIPLLKRYKVYSLSEFHSVNNDGKPYSLYGSVAEPIYGYKSKNYIKLYRPFSDIRFLYGGIVDDNYCFGLEQLPDNGDIVFITGGEKDVLALAAKKFNAISFNSETCTIPKDIIHNLTFRFKHIVLLYDVDKTGIDSSMKHEQQLSEYGVKRLLLPLSGTKTNKDISDYFKKGNSRKDLNNLFFDFLEIFYHKSMTMLKPCEIKYNNPPEKACEIISAGLVPLGTQSNLLCITGGEGSGKSKYAAAIVAGAIAERDVDTLGLTVSKNVSNKAILLYDTEQSRYQLHKNIASLLIRSRLTTQPEELKAFTLSVLSRKERLKLIVDSMDQFYFKYGGIHVVVIDGIADLISSANDEAESIRLVDELSRLASIYKTCIVCVLHFIPSGLKLRGHLGSEMNRKASGILSIELDRNDQSISVVKAIKVRDGGSALDVPIMQFAWNKDADMFLFKGEKSKEEKEKWKITELMNVASQIFEKYNSITYLELSNEIQSIMDVKERTAKSYIRFMKEKDIIEKDSKSNYSIKITKP